MRSLAAAGNGTEREDRRGQRLCAGCRPQAQRRLHPPVVRQRRSSRTPQHDSEVPERPGAPDNLIPVLSRLGHDKRRPGRFFVQVLRVRRAVHGRTER